MRFSFDLTETDGRQSPTPSPSSSTPKSEIEWFPLQNHPLFSSAAATPAAAADTAGRKPPNLMAWDGASRLYIWDLKKKSLHRISIRLGEPDPSSILAASPSKVLQTETPLSFEVSKISINRNGSALLLAGLEGLCVMYLYGRSSLEENTIICWTVSIGSEIYFQRNNFIRILQISWHPYSDTHLGILSSDSVFRVFDLSTDIGQPEQEYYLQPVEYGSCCNAAAICPVDFAFGGEHLWDKFSYYISWQMATVCIRVKCLATVYISWMTLLIFKSASIIVPISLGRTLFDALPLLPVTHGIRCNDLYAFVIGSYVIWTGLAGARYCIDLIRTKRTRVLLSQMWKWCGIIFKSYVLLSIWVRILSILQE